MFQCSIGHVSWIELQLQAHISENIVLDRPINYCSIKLLKQGRNTVITLRVMYNEWKVASKKWHRYNLNVKDYKLQVTSFMLQSTSYKLQITNYKSHITCHKLQVKRCKLHVKSYKLQVTCYMLQLEWRRKLWPRCPVQAQCFLRTSALAPSGILIKPGTIINSNS